jgi:iron(II)-dependent oxidoreductase
VLQQRFGRPVRMAPHHSAMHLSWWEADAWCRWAGRRLPSEAEWDCAARSAARRGFDWGGVHEWMAGTLQPWPGFTPGPWASYSQPWLGRARALRGASFATRARLHDPAFRGFALPDDDARFVGFRSCAL